MTTASTCLDHLKDIHSQILSNNANNDNLTHEIVEILGGIDSILSHYFESGDSLNEEQIERLLNTLNNNNTSQELSHHAQKKEYVYNISINDSVLQKLCPKLNTVRILSLMFNPYLIITLTISGLIWATLYFVPSLRTYTWSLILQSIFLVFITCYFIIAALTANVKITKLIFKTFEFWLKLYYVLSGTILAVIYRYHADDYDVSFGYARDYSYQSVCYAALRVVLVVIVITVSLLDAIPPISKRLNAAALITVAIFISVGAMYWSTFKVDNDIISIKMLGTKIEYAMVERIAGSYRILALFLWKSVFLYLYRRKYAVYVKTPYKTRVKWGGIENGMKRMMSNNALKQMQTMNNKQMTQSIEVGVISNPDLLNVETEDKQEL